MSEYQIVPVAETAFVIPAPAFAGVNLSPRKRGAGIQLFRSGHLLPQGWHCQFRLSATDTK